VHFGTRLSLCLAFGVAGVSLVFAVYQTHSEARGTRRELERHAIELAQGMEKPAEPLLASRSLGELQRMVERFRDGGAGAAVYDSSGQVVAATPNLAPVLRDNPEAVTRAVEHGSPAAEYFRAGAEPMHVTAIPLWGDRGVLGALAIYQRTAYIATQAAATWKRVLAGVAVETVLIVCVTLLMLRWGLGLPVARLAGWLRDLRTGAASAGPDPPPGLPQEAVFLPLRHEAERLATTLTAARAAAEREARLRDRAESLWTPERLRIWTETRLAASPLIAVSNREPYEHSRRRGAIECSVPASGLVTALEPVLRACHGTWIAQGTGDADRETVDEHDRLAVPPEHPEYTLRRVWLTAEEERGFYFGFANEGLWPLCHIAHTRPVFREEDWEAYVAVNRRFADAVLEEAGAEDRPAVLVQDYHFALVPKMIKEARPDARVAIFWHIPWPNPEAFCICPWQRELLEGLLGADLIGFHVQAHCNNFLESVDRVLESRIDWERFAVNRGGHLTSVHPFPISVASSKDEWPAPDRESIYTERAALLAEHGVRAAMMGIGVDRADYTKGLPERFLALERFFEKYPLYRGQFTFVQVAAPSRTRIRHYQDLLDTVKAEAERINRRFQTSDWRPIVLVPEHRSHREILPYYRAADLCLVTSLHDGMNLVAKEYVAAQSRETGALILSVFAGASHELVDALHVNPYDIEASAGMIHRALEMAPEERRARMVRMRSYVREHNIYRWAGNLVAELASVRPENLPAEPAPAHAAAGAAR
jgi:trehalose-6-phosphate synthase